MASAAAALLVGVSDPLAFLAQPGEDWLVSLAVIRKALELDAERRKNEVQALIDGIGHSVAAQVAKLFR